MEPTDEMEYHPFYCVKIVSFSVEIAQHAKCHKIMGAALVGTERPWMNSAAYQM